MEYSAYEDPRQEKSEGAEKKERAYKANGKGANGNGHRAGSFFSNTWGKDFDEAEQYARHYKVSTDGHLIGGGILRRGRGHSLIGLPGCGKTLFAVYAALSLQSGNGVFFGRPLERAKVVFFACEAMESTLDRFVTGAKRLGLPWPCPGLTVIPCGTIDLKDGECEAEVKRLISRLGADVFFVDTLNAAGAAKEDAEDMGAATRAVTRTIHETKAAGVILHHTPMDGSGRERGHGSFRGMLDLSLFIKDEGGIYSISFSKARDTAKGALAAFSVGTEVVGTTNLGEEGTVPYLVEEDVSILEASGDHGKRGKSGPRAKDGISDEVMDRAFERITEGGEETSKVMIDEGITGPKAVKRLQRRIQRWRQRQSDTNSQKSET